MVRQLRSLRRARGWTQLDVAMRLTPPVYPKAVARWESGESLPRQSRLRQLAKVFGVSIADLFGSRDDVGRPA